MGTPEFAVESLRQLVDRRATIVAVVTAPDKPKGRGKRTGTSPVKDYAIEQELPLLQPTNLKDPAFIEELKSLKADLQIVVAFRMLPEIVWSMPKLGTFNLHASLLPQYRGAAPINWAIINGETETGVTTFFLKHEIDTGNIILQEKEPILPSDNVGSLYQRMMVKGAKLVVKTVELIASGDYQLTEQQSEGLTLSSAPKIFKEDCEIDWLQPSKNVYDFIRGLSPYPCAWTIIQGKSFKIFNAKLVEDNIDEGTYKTDNQSYLKFGCSDTSLNIIELQPEGKRRMTIEEFLKGNKL